MTETDEYPPRNYPFKAQVCPWCELWYNGI